MCVPDDEFRCRFMSILLRSGKKRYIQFKLMQYEWQKALVKQNQILLIIPNFKERK